MRKLLSIITTLFAVSLLTFAASAQSAKPTKEPKFDAKLAKRLGADKYGMKRYVFVALKTAPNAPVFTPEESKKLFAGHFANMGRLVAEGKLAVAGPFNDPNKVYRGLFILNVETIEEAEKLVNTDPVIKSGMMIAELVPWWGSAALMDTNRIHKTIAKEKM